MTVPATDLAREHLGRPLPNAVLLGGFAAISGAVTLDAVAAAISEKFKGKLADGNIAAAAAAYDYVKEATLVTAG
jgi:pyruvate ferredoxin oxidoreductase gamma subunit